MFSRSRAKGKYAVRWRSRVLFRYKPSRDYQQPPASLWRKHWCDYLLSSPSPQWRLLRNSLTAFPSNETPPFSGSWAVDNVPPYVGDVKQMYDVSWSDCYSHCTATPRTNIKVCNSTSLIMFFYYYIVVIMTLHVRTSLWSLFIILLSITSSWLLFLLRIMFIWWASSSHHYHRL